MVINKRPLSLESDAGGRNALSHVQDKSLDLDKRSKLSQASESAQGNL